MKQTFQCPLSVWGVGGGVPRQKWGGGSGGKYRGIWVTRLGGGGLVVGPTPF